MPPADTVGPDRVFLYFHWVRPTPRKLRLLQRIAARQPEVVILGTTESVVEVFRRCGFAHVLLLPYPAPQPAPTASAVPFRQLLYAGAARQDKGFKAVVDLVALLAARNESIPVAVQISADHYGKLDAATREDIARLKALRYPPLDADRRDAVARGVCSELSRAASACSRTTVPSSGIASAA